MSTLHTSQSAVTFPSIGEQRTSIVATEFEDEDDNEDDGATLADLLHVTVKFDDSKPVSRDASPSCASTISPSMDVSTHSALSNSKRSILKRVSSYSALGESIGKSTSTTLDSSVRLSRVSSTVSFQAVQIREYNRTIGDNPSCMVGIPVSLDWSHSSESKLSLNDYEKLKGMKRSRSMMRMPSKVRESLLKNNLGYSDEELAQTKKEIKQIQRSRSLADITSPFWRVEHLAKSGVRKLKRTLGGSKTTPQTEHEIAVASAILECEQQRSQDAMDASIGSSQASKRDARNASIGSSQNSKEQRGRDTIDASIGSSQNSEGPLAF